MIKHETISGDGNESRRVVVKLGSNLLTSSDGQLDTVVLADLVRQVSALVKDGIQVAIVTSGAVAVGRDRLANPDLQLGISDRQVLAAIGQSRLVERYDTLLHEHGLMAAQALLTRADIAQRSGYLNARNTINALLQLGVVPIINENDVVADEELRGGVFGENDSLSALVANLVDADLLVMLSDVNGLFRSDPRIDPQAELIRNVKDVEAITEYAGSSGHGGRGGMRAKVEAARLAIGTGTAVVIANGRELDVLLRVVNGEELGTRFQPEATRTESRKRWMLSGLISGGGRLVIDEGAVTALCHNGKSLLPAGVLSVSGAFERGDTVTVENDKGAQLAVGICNYSANDVSKILGKKSDKIENLLGYRYGDEIIHRDNLVLT